MADRKKKIIWSCDWLTDEEVRKTWESDIKYSNPDFEPTDELFNESVYDCLWDESKNLNGSVDGVIVALANLGLWDGQHTGSKIIGSNPKDVLNLRHDCEWYFDGYNLRCTQNHHDGTNTILFRIAKDMDAAERICAKIYDGTMDEKKFMRQTKSLKPFLHKVYGW